LKTASRPRKPPPLPLPLLLGPNLGRNAVPLPTLELAAQSLQRRL